MTYERKANCKECGEEYTYSAEWAAALAAEGRPPTEYCPRCRSIHTLERNNVAMPYYRAQPRGARQPDSDISAGRLGRLLHVDRNHRVVSIESKFNQSVSDIRFGITDSDIASLLKALQECQVVVVVGPTGSGKSTFLPYRLIAPPEPFPSDLFTRFGQIVVTQPRVQATRGIPAFVAEDLHGSTLGAGGDVGYVHRGETASDRHSKLVFCTDGTLINWIAAGRLADISIVMIDEAHERSLNIDVILGLLRLRLPLYPHLKVIIASATIDADLFIRHFSPVGQAMLLKFQGLKLFNYDRRFSIKKLPGPTPLDEAIRRVVDQVKNLLNCIADGRQPAGQLGKTIPAPEGDILAFLPTLNSIDRVAVELRLLIADDARLAEREIEIHTLHSKLARETQDFALMKKAQSLAVKVMRALQQMTIGLAPTGPILCVALDINTAADTVKRVRELLKAEAGGVMVAIDLYDPSALLGPVQNQPSILVATYEQSTRLQLAQYQRIVHDRRVVIATNIAETSLTVDGIVYVVDTGLILRSAWDADTLGKRFETTWHSRDGCRQRWGRAGRVRDGWVYCLYNEQQFNAYEAHTTPEIRRAPLEAVALTAKRAGIDNVVDFPWIEPPNDTELRRALEALNERGVIDKDGDLTERGQSVALLGIEPDAGHLIYLADQLACAYEVITLLPMLSRRLHGGLLRWQREWDGTTRRAVRRLHESMKTACKDDITFLFKLYESWSESWRPEYDWLTDDSFTQLWPGNTPAIPSQLRDKLGEVRCNEFVKMVRGFRALSDFSQLVEAYPEVATAQSWLAMAEQAMRDTRRAAWARRFFVNHAEMLRVEAERTEHLKRLSIGKKKLETRSLDFAGVLDRARLVLAYAWPDRVYTDAGSGRYAAVEPRTRVREERFAIEIGAESLAGKATARPAAFWCGQKRQGHGNYPLLYAEQIAVLDSAWLEALNLPLFELGQWLSMHLRSTSSAGAGRGELFIDQSYPLGSCYSVTPVGSTSEGLQVAIGPRVWLPPAIPELTREGELIYLEAASSGAENDVDEDAGRDPRIRANLDAETSPELSEMNAGGVDALDDVVVQVINLSEPAGAITVLLGENRIADALRPFAPGSVAVVPQNQYSLSVTATNLGTNFEQTIWIDSPRSRLFLVSSAKDDGLRLRQHLGPATSANRVSGMLRLVNGIPGAHRLIVSSDNSSYTQGVPFLESTPYLSISAGHTRLVVSSEEGALRTELDLDVAAGISYTLAAVPSIEGCELLLLHDTLDPNVRADYSRESSNRTPTIESPLGLVLGQHESLPAACVAEVTGYCVEVGQVYLVLRSPPERDVLKEFADQHSLGAKVKLRAIGFEQTHGDEQVSLVVQPKKPNSELAFDLELVMEADQLSFASRYASVARIQLDTEFETVVMSFQSINNRPQLSCLPLLETHLPSPGSTFQSTIGEKLSGGGLHVILPAIPQLPVPFSAYVEKHLVPVSVSQQEVGISVPVCVDYLSTREKSLTRIPDQLRALLGQPRWHSHAGWEESTGKLWIEGRLTDADRLELRAAAGDDPRCCRAIDQLYRFSNTLVGRILMAEALSEFAASNLPGTPVIGTIRKIWQSEVLLELGKTIWAKVPRPELAGLFRGAIPLGSEVAVVVGNVDERAGYVNVRVQSIKEQIATRFPVGSILPGRVTRVESYGAFIELARGVAGLARPSDLTWGLPALPAYLVRVNDRVKVGVLRVQDDGKLDLTLRIQDNHPVHQYPADSQVQGEILKLLPNGALVRLAPGVVGRIDISELSYGRVLQADQTVGVGQKLTVRVLKVHGDPVRLDLSRKRAFHAAMSIPAQKIARLIGPGGRVIRSIKENTQTEIVVSANGSTSIWGPEQVSVDNACKLVREITIDV